MFLVVHILGAVAVLVALTYHLASGHSGYLPWIWSCVGIWAFDRLARFLRLSVLSYNAFKDTNAEAIVTGGENGLIRLTVTAPFMLFPRPGQYYFLYNPLSLTPWENHPFTLASWDHEYGKTKLHFLIAVRGGATSRLRRKIVENHSPTRMRVLVEGPYGHTEPVNQYERVLFIAGGSGITAILPYLEVLRNNRFTQSVSVVWSVKNNAYATDVLHKELAGCGDITIHVTEEEQPAADLFPVLSRAADVENKERQLEKQSTGSSSSPSVDVVVGRPDFHALLREQAKELVGSEKLAVVACGPGGMVDDLRANVVGLYGTGGDQVAGSQVDYFEELFAW